MKNQTYLNQHGVLTGDPLYVRNIVIERFFSGTLDDVADSIQNREPIRKFLSELEENVQNVLRTIAKIRKEKILDYFAKTQADLSGQAYAIYVKENIPSAFRPFFFRYKSDCIDPKIDIDASAFEWLKSAFRSFREEWKKTTVQEILDFENKQTLSDKQSKNN